ncbi:methylmalonyl-CoA mutase family protein [Hymenobacter sp. IS2118]|uniref:methylmalonyl-CoA mutase family protein n=1 Tax=Hymenobacter sp. IS2118 TaxID=1505605 RepID=UPI000550AF4A|nr:methylmalonyl-CoA mutase family protein [Hymenobacter sp. IS2118]
MSDTPVATPVSFAEFPAVTTAEWQARLARDLKGRDPATLRWPLPDGFSVEPFYHREALTALGGAPAPLPHPPAPWRNMPTIEVPAGEGRAAIDQAAAALASGADGIHFVLADATTFATHYLAEQLPLADTYIGYTLTAAPDVWLAQLLDAAPGTPLRGFLRFAPGSAPEGAELADYRPALRRCVHLTTGMPEFQALAINAAFFGNRGATATQQIAFGLNTAAALLAGLPNEEIDVAQVAAAMHWQVAIGPSYFVEMAKLRTLRRLWTTLLHAFGLPAALGQHLRVHTATASWTQTTLDPHTNLLRHTTEAMSAVLGGADSVAVAPFDSLYAETNDFSGRLARNLPVLLREESALGRVHDPAAGSYYLETLTDLLAQEAWGLFQQMEAAGGLPTVRAQVLEEIKAVATETFRRIAGGQQVVVGTNRFQNRGEQFSFHPKQLLRSASFDVSRATYPTEVLRLATALHFERREKKSKRAAVVLLGANTNQIILDTFLNMLLPNERPEIAASHPNGTLSLLYSSPEEATLMYATPEQFQRFARFIYQIPTEKQVFVPPTLLSSDMPTLQEAVRVFGFQEMKVQGYTTEQVLDRIQGR